MEETQAQVILADHVKRELRRHGVDCCLVTSVTFDAETEHLVVAFTERAHSSTGDHVPVAHAVYVLPAITADGATLFQP